MMALGLWFVHPGLAGAAALAGVIPIAIHLLHRWNHRRVRWAAMRFLLAARRQSKRRLWLHNYLLLLLRVALVALLGFAVARPFVPSNANLGIGSTHEHHILVMDNSLSMSARVDTASTRLDRAKAAAAALLDSVPKGDAISLVSVAQPASAPIAYAALDRRVVEEKLEAIEPTQRLADWSAAMAKAARILDDSEVARGNVTIHLFSDFDQAQWLGSQPETTKHAAANVPSVVLAFRRLADKMSRGSHRLRLIGLGDVPVDNLSVTQLRLASPVVSHTLPAQLLVEVTNHGGSAVSPGKLQVDVDGEGMYEVALPTISPQASATVSVLLGPLWPGVHLVKASLPKSDADVLDVDDARYLSIDVPESVGILLVDGKPGRSTLAGETGFLSAALSPASIEPGSTDQRADRASPEEVAVYKPKTIVPSDIEREALDEYGAIMLCNVSTLSAHQWRLLEDAVSKGTGLVIFAGDRTDPQHYNDLALAEGKGLLPGRLTAAISHDEAAEEPLRFRRDEPAHEMVSELVAFAESGFYAATVDRYLPIEPSVDKAEIILRYTNGEPAIVGSRFGLGRVVYDSTTANMSWTNLPSKGDFVSFVLRLAAYLTAPLGVQRNVSVGAPLLEAIPAAQTSMGTRAVDPSGRQVEGRVDVVGEGLALHVGPANQAGPWSLYVGAKRYVFAVNVAAQESDLRTTSKADLETVIGRPDVVVLGDPSEAEARKLHVKSTELVMAVTILVLGLLLVEAWLAMRVGPRRTAPSSPKWRKRAE